MVSFMEMVCRLAMAHLITLTSSIIMISSYAMPFDAIPLVMQLDFGFSYSFQFSVHITR